MKPITVQKLAAAVGAEVHGVDLALPLDDITFAAIERAWHAHSVLLFRNQALDDLQEVVFASRFGEPAETLKHYDSGHAHPAIMYVTNEKKDGKYIGALPDGEMYFHSDMCYLERPSMATMLFAIAIPPEGGNTVFAGTHAAYEALASDLKDRLQGRLAMNSYEPGYGASNVKMRINTSPIAVTRSHAHPVFRTHPATGRKAIYVNRLMTEYIVGMPRAESDEVLQTLFNHQEQPRFQYEHQWRVGDLLMWDNRCTLHARRDFDASHLRKLRRVTVKGERPV